MERGKVDWGDLGKICTDVGYKMLDILDKFRDGWYVT